MYSYLVSNKKGKCPALELVYDFDAGEERLGEIYATVLEHRGDESELKKKLIL